MVVFNPEALGCEWIYLKAYHTGVENSPEIGVFTREPFCVSEDDQGFISPMTPQRRKT
jgi:hypothetical protein